MSRCCKCDEAVGLFTCRGCAETFCIQHVSDHSDLLHERMNDIISEDRQFQENLHTYATISDYHTLKKQIDEWEQQSIKKIRQAADNARQQLSDVTSKHATKIAEVSKVFTDELNNAYKKCDFAEENFEKWSEKLEKLKNQLNALPKIIIQRDYNTEPFIRPVVVMEVPNERFQESIGNLRIEENRKLMIHGCFSAFGATRGRYTYSTGCYRFCFEIKSFNNIGLIFLGIISQSKSLQTNGLVESNAYGWIGKNNGPSSDSWIALEDIKINDRFEMIVNCDRKTVGLKNERTEEEEEMDVDLMKCPFPWQLYFGLSYWGDSIHLLP